MGNQAVATILREAEPSAASKGPNSGKANGAKGSARDLIDFDVPGLDAATAGRLRNLMAKRKRQQALDLLTTVLASRGEIDVALLLKGKMHYSAAVSGEGEADPPGYDTDDRTGRKTARPTAVRIGRSAFKNASVLYSTVIHEYEHVLQFQSAKARGTEGQRSLEWLIERQEVEAYAAEIFGAKNSGLWWQPAEMRDVWCRLHHEHWVKVGPKGRVLLCDLYRRAHGMAQSAVGDRWKLPFRP